MKGGAESLWVAEAPRFQWVETQEPTTFLTLKRFRVTLDSQVGGYDMVSRTLQDAAVIVPFFDQQGLRQVVLRAQARMPLVVQGVTTSLWEVPAGLIEQGESPLQAAERELFEELGTPTLRIAPLGSFAYPLPAVIAERQYFFCAEVAPPPWPPPKGDGSIFEAGARFHTLPLDEALAACRSGQITDAKTELVLRRLAELR